MLKVLEATKTKVVKIDVIWPFCVRHHVDICPKVLVASNFWLPLVIRLGDSKKLVVNYGDQKLVTKFF
jgi:hypothetical protein